jgi:hypothetical protein
MPRGRIIKKIGAFIVGYLIIIAYAGAQTKTSADGLDHRVWDKLLQAYVTSLPGNSATQVDYAGMASKSETLDSYLISLSGVSQTTFDSWPKPDQLAFLLNAYNAWTIKLVLSGDATLKSIKDLGGIFQSPWKKSFVPLLGKTRSLDDIEHGLIRGSGRYRDPRVHFAANCASVGCPALREEAYIGNKLDVQLEQQVRRFLADRSRNRLEDKTLKVSLIFKWYRMDFEHGWRGARTLADFCALYAQDLQLDANQISQLQQGTIKIDYLDYDWSLNRKREQL